MRTFVIAEAGISHDGDLTKALRLVDAAREAGADAVKFQTFNAAKLAQRRQKPELAQTLKKYEMPLSWLLSLKTHCDSIGIEFMTTCFDAETLQVAAPFVKRLKISHVESPDYKFVQMHLSYGKRTIISCTDGPRYRGPKIDCLYCTPTYPTPIESIYLYKLAMDYSGEYGFTGFSDHSRNVMMGALAVAAGASIVEAHFCHWETDWDNPDRPVSHDPSSLIRYVEFIRQAETAVYGQASEETKKLVRPESAPHTSRPQASAESGPSAYHPAVEP